jgi:hypothetical protein
LQSSSPGKTAAVPDVPPPASDELRQHQNRFRWVEYSLSASLMIVLIAGVTGITDIAALLALFGVNVWLSLIAKSALAWQVFVNVLLD